MTKELRRLTTIVILMFLTLFASTSVIQAVSADELAKNPNNKRTLYDSFEVQRGSIIAGGDEIATSSPSDDVYAWQRSYTDAAMWAPVTGYLNPVLQSATGLESKMTQELSGTGSSAAFARLERVLTGQDPKGSSVKTSLDPDVQRAAYEAMTNAGYTGGVVAIEPSTGRILAMVSTPSFDTNKLAVHDSDATNVAYEQLKADSGRPMLNRAIGGDLNAPGSTFKLVVASAALESGDFTADSKLPNPATYTLPGTSTNIHNAGRGTCGSGDKVTIADALRLSCNIPMAELAVKVGDDAIREQAEKFGFNSDFELPLNATTSVYPTDELSDDRTALTGYGQGDVIATPLQIAMVTAGIANGGTVMNPTMVDQVISPDLSVLSETQPSAFGQALDSGVADEMVSLMTSNVSNGVASNARIDGVDVGGKTGTAENGDGQPYSLWFTGFAPSDDPQVAVAVVVEDGGGQGQSGSGNAIAAPIAKQVMEAVLNK